MKQLIYLLFGLCIGILLAPNIAKIFCSIIKRQLRILEILYVLRNTRYKYLFKKSHENKI